MKHTRRFRRRVFEDKKSLRQLVLSIAGIISLLFLFFYAGIPFLMKISGFIAGFKKEQIPQATDSEILLEPFLDSLPEATNSGQISVSGSSTSGSSIVLYVNRNKENEKLVGKDGLFTFNNVSLEKGPNQIYAIAKSGNKESQPSQTLNISYKNQPPLLEISAPDDGSKFKRENREIEIKGKTEENSMVSVNDRFVFVEPNGNFSMTYRLNDGENKLEIKATDAAGNVQKVTRTVTYEP